MELSQVNKKDQATSQTNKNLGNQIQTFEKYCDGRIGVVAFHTLSNRAFYYNGRNEFLLCSTYKIPMAICLLQKVENNELKLEKMISIHNYDLRPGVSSTLNQLQYSTPVQMSILNLLQFMLQESCNTATDILLKIIGGPTEVMKMLETENITDLKVNRYVLEIAGDWDGIRHFIPSNHHCTLEEYASYASKISKQDQLIAKSEFKKDTRDHGTPNGMNSLLLKLLRNELINQENTQLLLKLMRRCKTGQNRLMGLLPPLTKVSHKTGTLTGYVNDVGIIYLPNDLGEIIISVFVETNKTQEVGERVIAEIARTLYDYFLY